MNQQTRRILAVVKDVFFMAKITVAAKHTGLIVEFIHDENKLLEATLGSPTVVLIDFNDSSMHPVDLVRKLKADPAERPVEVIGYLSHVQGDLIREAQKAGCDLVLPRSVFSQQLEDLLRQRSCHLPRQSEADARP